MDEQVTFPKEWVSNLGKPKKKGIPEDVLRFALWAREQGYTYEQIVKATGVSFSPDALGAKMRRLYGK